MNEALTIIATMGHRERVGVSFTGSNGNNTGGAVHPDHQVQTENYYLDEDQARALAMHLIEFFEPGATLSTVQIERPARTYADHDGNKREWEGVEITRQHGEKTTITTLKKGKHGHE